MTFTLGQVISIVILVAAFSWGLHTMKSLEDENNTLRFYLDQYVSQYGPVDGLYVEEETDADPEE